jgi:hypothetical protein
MKKNRLVLMWGMLAGMLTFTVLTGCKSTGKGAAGPESQSAAGAGSNVKTEMGEFLFVQTGTNYGPTVVPTYGYGYGNRYSAPGVRPPGVVY